MKDDPLDLPVRNNTSLRPANGESRGLELTERQLDVVIDTGAQCAEGVIAIGRGLVEIAQIKAQAHAEIDVIEARRRTLVDALRLEIERANAQSNDFQKRAEAAASVISAVMEKIPESDHAARLSAIGTLNDLVGKVLTTPEPLNDERG